MRRRPARPAHPLRPGLAHQGPRHLAADRRRRPHRPARPGRPAARAPPRTALPRRRPDRPAAALPHLRTAPADRPGPLRAHRPPADRAPVRRTAGRPARRPAPLHRPRLHPARPAAARAARPPAARARRGAVAGARPHPHRLRTAAPRPAARPDRAAAARRARTWGAPHDPSAALLGGVAGHAGVFSCAADLAVFAEHLLGGTGPLADWFAESRRPCTAVEPGLHRGLAWLVTADDDVAYHHGFTGTSLFLAPRTGRYVVLCTNAVYHGWDRARLAGLRTLALRTLAG
ncbi:hypothetical protein KCH_23490 [Kitasatospora cheerisanensis KCTC 2395]|uniref:Beta-lactamase-related domain-containing protein n=1 Tax=Kitasatospora cheerisanensis KCTC 2395 TaxID=1348663 RepID=A0A066YWM9_9ACTN|nr:hypothetical protein KCH_23490 [Kitasatospora cheerisanensis KCTC 2395]